jgi:hypothetical protein
LICCFYAADEAAANPVPDSVDPPAVAVATPPGEEHDAVKPSISVECHHDNEIVLIDILMYDVSTFMDFVQANKQGLATVMFWDMCEVFRSLCADGKVLPSTHALLFPVPEEARKRDPRTVLISFSDNGGQVWRCITQLHMPNDSFFAFFSCSIFF